ncbi:hypothetical protein KSF78_0002183 [Schistosoma japonicum]|nr:hypothetical protein KSF78_0002183 [Schistosoma japonicum]
MKLEQLLNEYLLKWNNKPLINESFESISIEKQFTEKIQITKITVIAGIQVITTFVRFGFRRLQNMVSRNKLVYCSLFELVIISVALFPFDKRFRFQTDQYFLSGFILGTLIIWMNLIISSEIALIYK